MMRYERTSPVRHPGRIAAVVVLLVAVLGVLLLQKGVFVLRNVWVEGVTRYDSNQVVAISGLRYGQSVFSINQQDVADSLQRDRFLTLDSIYIDYPDGVILRVRERMPRAALLWLGRLVLVDEIDSVMDVSGQLDTRLQVPVVTGMELTVTDVGRPLGVRMPAQFDTVKKVLNELELQTVTARVAELNVANLDNLYLVTQEGLKVELGDSEQLEQKIGMMRATLDELKAMGVYTGLLDVSAVYVADYQEERDFEREYAVEPTAVPNELVGR